MYALTALMSEKRHTFAYFLERNSRFRTKMYALTALMAVKRHTFANFSRVDFRFHAKMYALNALMAEKRHTFTVFEEIPSAAVSAENGRMLICRLELPDMRDGSIERCQKHRHAYAKIPSSYFPVRSPP